MPQNIRLFTALIATSALLLAPVALAQDAKARAPAKADAPAKSDAPAKGKDLYSQAYFDFMLKQRTAQGQPDSPELRAAVRDELNTRELLVREAKKQGLDKSPAVKTEMDLTQQTVLVRAYMSDYLKAHPVPDDVLHKEYDSIKGQIGDKEYKVRHILVDKEDEAKDIIAALQKGEKFEKLAERSKDTGSKATGGDLDWNAPANFVKPFADAMVALPKGKFTTTPVKSQFGWHVIEVDDIRDAKVPTFEEVKPQLAQRMQGQIVDKYLRELRAKNGF
ncbi:MAG TPA: peptidylprolyl isomerase [Casimicrobiaceae bacterium]|nr:peptidylprolyl isomerase [Casimicrobiaceae bacterium]